MQKDSKRASQSNRRNQESDLQLHEPKDVSKVIAIYRVIDLFF